MLGYNFPINFKIPYVAVTTALIPAIIAETVNATSHLVRIFDSSLSNLSLTCSILSDNKALFIEAIFSICDSSGNLFSIF